MTVESDNNTSSLLRRIHGEEASGSTVTGHDAQALMAAQQTLFDAGIDTGTLYGRAVDEIELSERLAERGITPPRRLWRMSDDEFAELDNAQLEDHLSAYGIDVPDMLSSLEDTVRIKNRRPLLGRLLDTVVGTVNGALPSGSGRRCVFRSVADRWGCDVFDGAAKRVTGVRRRADTGAACGQNVSCRRRLISVGNVKAGCWPYARQRRL